MGIYSLLRALPPRNDSEEALRDVMERFYRVEERRMQADLAWMQADLR